MKDKLTKLKESLQKGKAVSQEEMGINLGYKKQPAEYTNAFNGLIEAFYAAETLEEKEAIVDQIYNLKGDVPFELEVAMNEMKAGKSR